MQATAGKPEWGEIGPQGQICRGGGVRTRKKGLFLLYQWPDNSGKVLMVLNAVIGRANYQPQHRHCEQSHMRPAGQMPVIGDPARPLLQQPRTKSAKAENRQHSSLSLPSSTVKHININVPAPKCRSNYFPTYN